MRMSDYFPEVFQGDLKGTFTITGLTWYLDGEKHEDQGERSVAIEYAVLNHDRLQQQSDIFRSKLEIFSEILDLIESGANLSPRQVRMLNSKTKRLLNKND